MKNINEEVYISPKQHKAVQEALVRAECKLAKVREWAHSEALAFEAYDKLRAILDDHQ